MRILFACVAADGHFNPLTGIAMHLKDTGHDVRWYTGRSMADRLARMGITLHPFARAMEITGDTLPELFPERAQLRGPGLIRFDGEKVFLANVPAYLDDVTEINREFPFDLLFCDAAFLGARLVKHRLGKRVFILEPGWESMADDPGLPPPFLGLRPAVGHTRRWAYWGLKRAMDLAVNRHLRRSYNASLLAEGSDPISWSIFDEQVRVADAYFLNGVPGLAYPREHAEPGVQFLGACRPYRDPQRATGSLANAVDKPSGRTFLVSQGTVDNQEPDKLMAPAIQALQGPGCLVLVATGSARVTADLRRRFTEPGVLIEDWIDFDAVLPRVDVFVCNGGSGSLLSSFTHGVPVVVAGTREGKNDNNAHAEHAGVGINLRTEKPTPRALRRAVAQVLVEPRYRRNAERIRDEIAQYSPHDIVDAALADLVSGERVS